MGEASQRKARLKGLQPFCVGPSEFGQAGGVVVFIARNIGDAKTRMLTALADVISRSAFKPLEQHIKECQDKVGWILVTYTPDGGVLYQQLVNSKEAIERVIGMLGEGHAARKNQWSAMVFGSPSDVEAIRSFVQRFQDDVKIGAADVTPIIEVTQGLDPKVHLQIPRSDVEKMDLAPALMFFDTFATSFEVIERMGGNVVVSFSGYDDDDRFLGEIPAVKAFLRQLVSFAPWAPLVLDTSTFFVFVPALDSRVAIKTNNGMTVVESSPEVSKAILDDFKWAMAEFLGSRFFVSEIPPSMRGVMHEWIAFFNSGPDVRPAPEWTL